MTVINVGYHCSFSTCAQCFSDYLNFSYWNSELEKKDRAEIHPRYWGISLDTK